MSDTEIWNAGEFFMAGTNTPVVSWLGSDGDWYPITRWRAQKFTSRAEAIEALTKSVRKRCLYTKVDLHFFVVPERELVPAWQQYEVEVPA